MAADAGDMHSGSRFYGRCYAADSGLCRAISGATDASTDAATDGIIHSNQDSDTHTAIAARLVVKAGGSPPRVRGKD